MNSSAHPPAAEELLGAQRDLRLRLLDDGHALHVSDRELAAEMLLYLDDPLRCVAVCAAWLVRNTRADRVDGGFATRDDLQYSPIVESQRSGMALPTVLGATFDAHDGGIQAVWRAGKAVLFADARSDVRIGGNTRRMLGLAGTCSKMAVALRNGPIDVGLLCVDSCQLNAWSNEECERLGRLAQWVIAPILHTARALQDRSQAPTSSCDFNGAALTPAELSVAQLVAAGLNYKEIARRLEKSRSTVDHQLRSIRAKLGVNSMPMLVRELSRLQSAKAAAVSSISSR